MRLLLLTLFTLNLTSCSTQQFTSEKSQLSHRSKRSLGSPVVPKIIGYYYHGSSKYGYTPDKIPTQKLTHIAYGFVEASVDGQCTVLSKTPEVQKRNLENLKAMKKLKNKNKTLKTMLSIGGHGHSDLISDAVATEAGREKFVRSCVELIKKYSFDGIDMDWESPFSKQRAEDKENLVLVLKEFRKQLPEGALLSAAISADEWSLKKRDISGMDPYLDWFGLMMYDYCEPKSEKTCHHSQYRNTEATDNGSQAVQWLVDRGIDKQKLVLGVPFYGYVWKVDSLEGDGLGQKVIPTDEVPQYDISYDEIKLKYTDAQGFTKGWDETAGEPYLINRRENIFISYDNERSLEAKAKLAKDESFGGIMIWELAGNKKDHFLLDALRRGFGISQ